MLDIDPSSSSFPENPSDAKHGWRVAVCHAFSYGHTHSRRTFGRSAGGPWALPAWGGQHQPAMKIVYSVSGWWWSLRMKTGAKVIKSDATVTQMHSNSVWGFSLSLEGTVAWEPN